MRLDPTGVHQPVEHVGGAIGRVSRQAIRMKPEPLIETIKHGAGRTNLSLPNGASWLDVNNDRSLQIDQIVVRVSEECMALVGASPLRGRVGGRHKFRNDL